MLALSFLVLIGVMLIAEGLHHHIPKGYIYFAMGFSVAVEFLNLRRRRKQFAKARLHGVLRFHPQILALLLPALVFGNCVSHFGTEMVMLRYFIPPS